MNKFDRDYAYDGMDRLVFDGDIACAYDAAELRAVRYRFQGRERSAATGLTNFRMRCYDAATGRWLSKDPIGLSGGLNLYAFCGVDPVNREDFFGNCPNDPASDIPPVVGPQTHHGPHGDYRADPFGHGRKPDGTPKDPHIDQYPKKGGHNRFDQNGDLLRGGKGRVPKADRGPLVRQLKILESSCLKCRQLWWCQVGSLWDQERYESDEKDREAFARRAGNGAI